MEIATSRQTQLSDPTSKLVATKHIKPLTGELALNKITKGYSPMVILYPKHNILVLTVLVLDEMDFMTAVLNIERIFVFCMRALIFYSINFSISLISLIWTRKQWFP